MSRMLYKHPGIHPMHGDFFDYIIINEAEVESKLADGWAMTTDEAKNKDIIEADIGEDEPTREELETKATELGIKFDKRTSDSTLLKKIEEALNVVD